MGTATYVGTDATTQGDWIGVYGQDGGYVPESVTDPGISAPAYVSTFSAGGAGEYSWSQHTSDATGLLRAGGDASDRFQVGWNTISTITHEIVVYRPCRLAVYYWDSDAVRILTASVVDSDGSTVLDMQVVDDFAAGKWFVWDISGHIYVKTQFVGGSNAVVNGFFFSSTAGANGRLGGMGPGLN